MGKTKKGLAKQVQSIKNRIIELEEMVRKDPLRKHPEVYEELEKMKKKLAEE